MTSMQTVFPVTSSFWGENNSTAYSLSRNFWSMFRSTVFREPQNSSFTLFHIQETQVTSSQVIERENRIYGTMLLAIERAEAEFSRENWNGQGALPVSRESLNTARNFALALPEDISEEPAISAFQDGTLSLAWESEKAICTLSMEKDNCINYAMNDDNGADYGKRRLVNGVIPDVILQLIRRTIHYDAQS